MSKMATLSVPLAPLAIYSQFILYRLVPSTTRPGKTDKLPVNPNTMQVADAHDQSAWCDYQTVAKMEKDLGPEYGIGFVFTEADPFFFLDIDNCAINGKWSDIANTLMAALPGAAVEVSQSRKGLHIFGITGPINHGCKNAALGLELYTSGRFVALIDIKTTGNAATDCTQPLQVIVQRYFPPGEETTPENWRNVPVAEWAGPESDDELIARMLKSKSAKSIFGNAAKVSDLWTNNEQALALAYSAANEVDPYDRSSADMALAMHLAFWTGKNHARMHRLMLMSGLVRDKWARNKTYLRRTILKTVSMQADVYKANMAADIDSSFQKEMRTNAFILPSNHYSIVDSAEHIFANIAKHRKIFICGGLPVELGTNNDRYILMPVTPEAFRSRIESYGKKTMSYIVHHDQIALKPKLCSNEDAKALLASKQMTDNLPSIRSLLNCSVLSKDLKILSRGYNDDNGGLLVTNGEHPQDVPVDKGVPALLNLLRDFVFSTCGDYSRAVSMIITPALKMSGFISSACPVDIAEAEESQSGKTYRLKLNAAVYNDAPIIVPLKKGGVGSVDESIGSAIAKGRPFILLDNFRGNLDSAFLEAVITTPEAVPVRLPMRAEQIIDARTVTFQLSSNGVYTTKDMANRSCMVRIRKKHDKQWYIWPEGDLIDHVKKYQAYYLGCVFSVIKEWSRRGCQKTDTTDHDMIEWAQILDWIVQNIFQLSPLLDGHKAIQNEISDPGLVWLRSVCIAAENAKRLGAEFQAHDIAELCGEADITWPGGRTLPDRDAEQKYVGTLMKKIFQDEPDDKITIDNYILKRTIKPIFNEISQRNRDKKIYTITGK